jgi:hypothetical protein
LNYDTAKKQFDQRDVTHHALESNGVANAHLLLKRTANPVYNTHAHPAEPQGECAAHYVKSKEAVDTPDAALPHSLEGAWLEFSTRKERGGTGKFKTPSASA